MRRVEKAVRTGRMTTWICFDPTEIPRPRLYFERLSDAVIFGVRFSARYGDALWSLDFELRRHG